MKFFDYFKKYAAVRFAFELTLTGLVVSVIALICIIKADGENGTILIVFAAGFIALVAGAISLARGLKRPADDYAQYNRIDEEKIDPVKKAEVEEGSEEFQDYIFHYTGKLNQSFVMKDTDGNEVYRADCGGVKLFKDTDYNFVNVKTGVSLARKIGHTLNKSVGATDNIQTLLSSSFDIDGQPCWEFLEERGYGFDMSIKGLACNYDVRHYGVYVGHLAMAGTGLMNEKYRDSAAGKIPTNGIFKIECRPGEIEGLFYICFCITRTEITMS